MGIKEAYKLIDKLSCFNDAEYTESYPYLDYLKDKYTCEGMRKCMDILERECPEVLEERK